MNLQQESMLAMLARRIKCRRRRGIAALSVAAFAAAGLCHNGLSGTAAYVERRGDFEGIAREEGGPLRRHLAITLDESKLMEEVDSDSVRYAALGEEDDEPRADANAGGVASPPPPAPLPPYTLVDAIREADAWETAFAVVVYDPESDAFVGHYSGKNGWTSSCKKLWGSMNQLANALRTTFPDRFRGSSSDEFAVAIGSGDYPHVRPGGLPRGDGVGVAPVLQFGSVFRDRGLYPNMIAMPMPGTHLGCFEEWTRLGRVCGGFLPRDEANSPHGSLVFGDESRFKLEWDDLIPQVAWRGTDFGYLPTLLRPKLSQPLNNDIERAVVQRKSARVGQLNKKIAAAQALREHYDRLLPRWKGAVLTAEAELDPKVRNDPTKLPWANIKISRHMKNGMMMSTVGSAKYKEYDEVGIATGDFMAGPDIAKYKYHVDIGGGGGTTWMGTIEKLAMPGLLFHHITPTKDYVHDRLVPWRHYVPVAPDLRDLKEKFDWAESHPRQARRIADRATEFMRRLGTPEGFGRMFEEDFVEPLRRVIEAYQPVASSHPGTKWRDVLQSPEGGSNVMLPVMECSGFTNNPASCHSIGGDAVTGGQKKGWHSMKGVPIWVERNTN